MELIEKLLNLLNRSNVSFVVIGAYALPIHGYTRATGDIDILINWFASLEDIIKMKRAAGRVKDKEDLKYLTRILKLRRKKNEHS